MVQILKGPEETRARMEEVRRGAKRIGFVPAMGAPDEGHVSLVREAKKRSDVVFVSIFVNPTQFGPNEDFTRYPRDLEGDVKKVSNAGAEIVFAPEVSAMYP